MTDSQRRRIRIDALEAEVRNAEKRLQDAKDRLDNYTAPIPKEPLPGSVIRFTILPRLGGNSYHYAAVLAGGRWYTTGSSCPRDGYTWEQLVDFIRSGYATIGPVILMNDYRELHGIV